MSKSCYMCEGLYCECEDESLPDPDGDCLDCGDPVASHGVYCAEKEDEVNEAEEILNSYINGQFQQCYSQLDELDGGLAAFLEWAREYYADDGKSELWRLLTIAIKYAKHKGF